MLLGAGLVSSAFATKHYAIDSGDETFAELNKDLGSSCNGCGYNQSVKITYDCETNQVIIKDLDLSKYNSDKRCELCRYTWLDAGVGQNVSLFW